ncbi:MAG: WecB/TagA/CpsF family glycosyltransferase [Planctomycetales bacterium]|nr:WecB/TagA/CpsF family glycosyltransferase [Planctomycetales bacterium]
MDRVDMPTTLTRVFDWLDDESESCRYIVTPNLDHAVILQNNDRMQEAYRHASLVLAAGWPLVVFSRWFGKTLPERVAGSDLVPNLMERSAQRGGLRVFLLGGMPGVGEQAAETIARRWPHVEVVGVHSPPFGFEKDPAENQRIVDLLEQTRPELLVVGLGAPKQEIWLAQHYGSLRSKVAVAAGATIDFLAGVQTRAPRWMQRMHLEWLYRAASDPKRLAGRYLRDALALPGLLWRERQATRREK